MGSKRKRVQIDTSKIEFDPDFFDRSSDHDANVLSTPREDTPSMKADSANKPVEPEDTTGHLKSWSQHEPHRTPPYQNSSPPSIASECAEPKSLMHEVEQEQQGSIEHSNSRKGMEMEPINSNKDSKLGRNPQTQNNSAADRGAIQTSGNHPEVVVIGSSSDEQDIVDLCEDDVDSDIYATQVTNQFRDQTAPASSAPDASAPDASLAPAPSSIPMTALPSSVVIPSSSPPRSALQSPAQFVPQLTSGSQIEASREVSTITESDAELEATSRKRARKEDSLRSVLVHVESLVPGSESTFEVQWSYTQSLFDLRNQFGSHTVLVHEGSKKPWFYSPKKIASSSNKLVVQIVTEKQWDDMARKAELGEFVIPSSAPDEDGTPNSIQDSNESGFVITIASRSSTVRAMVTQQTTIKQLADHFKTESNTPATKQIRFVLDGDTLNLNDTVGDLDIEEDDKLDVYVE